MQLHMDSALFSIPITEAIIFKTVLWTKGNQKFSHKIESTIGMIFSNKQNNFLYSLKYFVFIFL